MRRPWVGVDRGRWGRLWALGAVSFLVASIAAACPAGYLRAVFRYGVASSWASSGADAALENAVLLLAGLWLSAWMVLRRGPGAGRIGQASLAGASLAAAAGMAAYLEGVGAWPALHLLWQTRELWVIGVSAGWVAVWSFDVVRRERDESQALGSEADAGRLDTLWERLGGEDADAAAERLAELGSRAVDFLVPRLHPASDDPEWIATLVADLDRPDRRIWEAAAAELQGLGRLAEDALGHATFETPEGGFRRERILRGETYPETRRKLRALQVLRKTGHPEALRALGILARGAPDAPFTQAAVTALRPDALAR